MTPAARPAPRGQTHEAAHVPAPIGGINTVDGGSAMPAQDAVYCFNMLPAEYGLRLRHGYREWCTGLTGAADNQVRTILPFAGARASGASDALFATTSTGIWDVSDSSAAPTQVLAFATSANRAGYGTWHAMSTAGGRFLFYCDEENGLHLYTESTDTWARVSLDTAEIWRGSTAYDVGNYVLNGGNEYLCTGAGTSAASGGPTTTGSAITDGTVTWAYQNAAPSSVIGPCLADQQLGNAGDPATFCHVTVWKNRAWFTEKDSTRAWYLDVGSVYGVATSIDFGRQLRSGGGLRGLWNWSYDGGNGLDTLLVGLGDAGDVVIYQGTDPSSASTFGLKGVWSVGALPDGRRLVTDYGGDLLVMSLVGIVPLSKLVVGAPEESQSLYATRKVANLFGQLAAERRTLPGWALHIHPEDNALLVLVPTTPGEETEQLVMAFGTRGWARYRDVPMLSVAVWEGVVYFGDAAGRVHKNIDYVDAVLLDGSGALPIDWSVFTAYRNLGNARRKQVHLLRPILLSGQASPTVQATAKYDFDLLEPSSPSAGSGSGWDSDTWDAAVWGGDFTPSSPTRGAVGMGRDVAVALRGNASSRTVLVGVDVVFEQGGVL